MRIKHQFLLPLLTAATAMMVAPHAGATAYVYPAGAGGTTFTAGNAALANGDTLVVSSSLTHTAEAIQFADGVTVTVNAGSTVTTTGANSVIKGNILAATAPAIVNISGTVTANGTNPAINLAARTNVGANSATINVLAGGIVNGDISPADAAAADERTIIVVKGTWNGGLLGAATATSANSSLTVDGGSVVTGATGINTPTTTAGYNLIMKNSGNITGSIYNTATTSGLILKVDTGTSKITGNVAPANANAANLLTMGSVDTANAASLTITGTLDTVGITQAVPGALIVNGKVGAVSPALIMTMSAGTSRFVDTVVSGNAAFSGTHNATFVSNYTPGTLTTTNSAAVVVTGNLLSTGAVSVGDASSLTVTGTATALTGAFATTNANGTGANATFNGNFATTSTATVVANTTANFNGTVAITGATANNGTTTFLGSTVAFTGNITNGAISSAAKLVFGKADGSVAVAISGAGDFTNTTGTMYFHKGVTLAATNDITVTAGTVYVGRGVALLGAATTAASASAILDMAYGSSIAGTLTSGAASTIKVRGMTTAAGVVSGVSLTSAYTPAQTAVVKFMFDDSAHYGNITAAAAVDLSTGTDAVLAVEHGGGYVAPGTYTVLTTSTLTASTATPVITSSSKTTTFAVTQDVTAGAGKVTVTATRAAALNTFATGANSKSVLSSVNTLTAAQYQGVSAGRQATINAIEALINSTTSTAVVDSGLKGLMPNASAIASMSGALKGGMVTLAGRLDSLAYDMRDSKAYVAGGSSHGDALWVRGIYSRANQKADTANFYDGYTANRYGAMIGFDTMRFNHSTLGMSLGYVQSKTKDRLNMLSSNNVKSFQILPYGSFNLGDRGTKGFIDWFVGYTYNTVKGSRVVATPLVAVGTTTYDYKSHLFSAKGTYGLDKVVNRNLTLTPFVSALLSFQPSVSYTEKEAANVAGQTITNSSKLGAEFELGFKGVVRPDAGSKANTRFAFRAMGVWTAAGANLKTSGILAGTSAYSYNVKQQKFGARAGVSAVFEMLRDLDLEFSYDLEARSKYMAHTGLVEFKYHF
jgi:hypothetical protein